MPGKDKTTKISKTLSYVLRHNPSSIGVELDKNGWATVKDVLSKLKVDGTTINFDELKLVVDTNNKKRFSFNDDHSRIRASQGHSIEIDLNFDETKPPALLYHGTTDRYLPDILKWGLKKMKRHHVHLNQDVETAIMVGKRHGKPVVLAVNSSEMHKEGFIFYVLDNQVWLTDSVPARFIEIVAGPGGTKTEEGQ